MYFGNASQSAILPTLVRPPLATVTPSLELKRFLPFPLDTAAAVNLFPSFSTAMVGIPPSEQALPLGNWKSGLACRTTCMDPVQKAIINHTFGLPPQPKRKHVVVCTVCRLKFNSESQASAHYKGTKHGKKLKALEAPSGKQKVGEACGKDVSKSPSPVPVPTSTSTDKLDTTGALLLPKLSTSKGEGQAAGKDSPSESVLSPSLETSSMADADGEPETEEEKAKRLLYCSLCKVAVNSASQLEAHNSGSKHKTMLDARNGSGAIKSFPRPGQKSRQASPAVTATGLQNKTFQCEICDVHVNSETQLKQHISSRRHKDRAAGKPAKPKYSPYSKPQRGQVAPPVRLVLRKELNLGKTLQAGLLPGHLAAAAATLPAFSLRSTPSLYQTPPLPTPLLRPAPGPVRTTHAPLLFTPY